MDATRLDRFARRISARLTRRTSLGLLAGASLPILGLVTSTDARKRKKLTLCVNGQTVKTPKKKAKKLLKQGATKGACVTPPGCPNGQKACGDACIPDADCCNCTGSDVCENGSCAPLRCGNGGPCTVFVTSQTFLGGDFGGLDGADTTCTTLASGAGLAGTFKAWLSDGTENAKDRFDNPNRAGPWELVSNGDDPPPTVANNLNDLVTCPSDECLQHAIDRDEDGAVVGVSGVWTGTKQDGSADLDNCLNWTADDFLVLGRYGLSSRTNAEWTDGTNYPCNDPLNGLFRLYCFEQAT